MAHTTEASTEWGEVLKYGQSKHQSVQFMLPRAPGPVCGMAVLIHGGYWRARFDATLMLPLAHSLTAQGWAIANVEYRRIGNGGGWPQTLDDVQAAIRLVRSSNFCLAHSTPVVGIGHSVGGQLALLAGKQLDAIVALAPVTDVARTDREHLGEDAASEFMNSSWTQSPQEFDRASPIRQLPLGRPILVIHGDDDDRVPIAHSLDFRAAAESAGDDMVLRVIPGLSHRAAIDPQAGHWPGTLQWMTRVGNDR